MRSTGFAQELARKKVVVVEAEIQVLEKIGGGARIWPACGPEKGTI
ncbi:MAG: hypothetical protein MUP41_13810 [Desulfobacterales bacterium]|nr:hypothetical protein [Desulfobacterales bacterium]